MTSFDTIYQNIIKRIMEEGEEELNERTGHKTKALAEQVWFIQGEKDATFLRKFTKIWDAFLETDGTLSSAYGWRWRNHFGRDQLGKAIELLEKEPSSRHGVIVTWDPSDDGHGGTPKKNVPCPYTYTINIIGGRLNMHNIVRSNDMILGCPFDVFGFALLQCMIAERLGVRPGVYTHSISNAHVYDNHYEGAKEIIGRTNDHQKIELHLPKDAFRRAEQKDENLVGEILADLQAQYNPLPPIGGLEIAL